MGVFRRGKDWWIDYYVQGRRKREKVGESKSLAELALKKRKLEIAEGKFLDIQKQNKIKFKEFAEVYIENYAKPNKSSAWRDEISIEHLNHFFGGKCLYEITPLDIEGYKRKRKEEVSTSTVNRELTCLKTIFNKAKEWGKAKENPVSKVKLFKEENKRLRFLEKEEIAKLVSACEGNLSAIVTLALHTGMRRGEILSLKWRDIDFSRKIITLLKTKSGEKREVPMDEIVYETFLTLPKHKESPYLFCYKNGKPIRDIRGSFQKALEDAGIEDFRFHDLRHTFASQLVMMGIDLKTVQELLGHKTFEMTLRYAHLSPNHKRAAIDHFCNQMDTIWTPEENQEKVIKEDNFGLDKSGIGFLQSAGVVKLVDALDSKSSGAYTP